MPPKNAKRKATAAAGGAAGKKQAKKAGQTIVKKEFDIPIDEGAQLGGANPHVFVDNDDTIYDASLNQSNVSNNNNKVSHTWSATRFRMRLLSCLWP